MKVILVSSSNTSVSFTVTFSINTRRAVVQKAENNLASPQSVEGIRSKLGKIWFTLNRI